MYWKDKKEKWERMQKMEEGKMEDAALCWSVGGVVQSFTANNVKSKQAHYIYYYTLLARRRMIGAKDTSAAVAVQGHS